ncbi:MAG: hypothetical protein AB7V16_07060 [Vulcanibacillus sp.]
MKLTQYESEIMYLAKNHYGKEAEELKLSIVDVIYALRLKHYIYDPRDKYTLFYFKDNLIELCFKLGLLNTPSSINNFVSQSYFDGFELLPKFITKETINSSLVMKHINYLLSMIASVSVREIVNGEWIDLIELTEKDFSFLQEYVDFLKEGIT